DQRLRSGQVDQLGLALPGRLSLRGSRRLSGRRGLALCSLDIRLDDAAAGPRARKRREVQPPLLCHAARDRGGLDALAPVALRRWRRWSFRRLSFCRWGLCRWGFLLGRRLRRLIADL